MPKEHLKGEQLEMFMPAHRLMDMPSGDTALTMEGDPQSLDEDYATNQNKLDEAKTGGVRDARYKAKEDSPTLYSDIKKRGVVDPVFVGWNMHGKNQIWDGNHRIAVAHDINPQSEIPVQYTNSRDWIS